MKKLLFILTITGFVFAYQGDIKTQAQESFDKAMVILQTQSDLSKATDEIFSFLENEFNMELMARFSLGKHYETLNESQKTTYMQAFKKLLKKDFISKIEFYKNEKITITDVATQNNRGYITAILNYQGADRNIILSIAKSKNSDNWFVYDIKVDDISLISTYKTQFANLYIENDFNTFIDKISQ